MPLTNPIPKEAIRVMGWIHTYVPKPDTFPTQCLGLKWRIGMGKDAGFWPVDPLELLAFNLFRAGITENPVTPIQARAFHSWWHDFEDGKEAVDALWGE